jgi:hypothetical protein
MGVLSKLFGGDKYRAERDARIKAEGDAAYNYVYGTVMTSNLDDVPIPALRALYKVVTNQWDEDTFYEALREARLDESVSRKCEQLAQTDDTDLLKKLLKDRI